VKKLFALPLFCMLALASWCQTPSGQPTNFQFTINPSVVAGTQQQQVITGYQSETVQVCVPNGRGQETCTTQTEEVPIYTTEQVPVTMSHPS